MLRPARRATAAALRACAGRRWSSEEVTVFKGTRDPALRVAEQVQAKAKGRLLPKDHKEGAATATWGLSLLAGGAVLVWFIKAEMYGDVAPGPFDVLDARLLFEDLFDSDPAAAAKLVKLLWNMSGGFNFRTGEGVWTARADVGCPVFSQAAGVLARVRAIRDELEAQRDAAVYPRPTSLEDVFAFGVCVAVERLGGPPVPFHYGRSDVDAPSPADPTDAVQLYSDFDELRRRFYRSALSDREAVAVMAVHSAAKTHRTVSGLPEGLRWPGAPKNGARAFGQGYFQELLETEWVEAPCGRFYHSKKDKNTIITTAEHMMMQDKVMRYWAVQFAREEGEWADRFVEAFSKLLGQNRAPWGPVEY